MAWRTVVVNSHSKLSYKNHHLYYRSARATELIHLSEIDILILETTDITLTTMLLKHLADHNVLVVFCDEKRLPKSMLQPYYGRHDSSLQLKKQMRWAVSFKNELWRNIIRQKILNQASFLQELGANTKAETLRHFSKGILSFDESNREAHASRLYFTTLFGADFVRTDPSTINAALDYGYTLILSMFAREIVKNGCLTQLGIKHDNQFNEFNLASDLMEPFRIIIDTIVYKYQGEEFKVIKLKLFKIFSRTFAYREQEMFLTNIIADYTKRSIKFLNEEDNRQPEFRDVL
ncbi:type II CRISPR-associated endonuclease Cas1 [Facklamia sp. P9177]|uniref:type II CRISPR-associated endonuclease Cas1 n=1 Tax=Facklamia sp. P9177 TaxID=3421945 RepID=UPI003D1834E1